MEKDQIVWIEYEVVDAETEEVLDSTKEETITENAFNRKPGPTAIMVGAEIPLPGLMEAIETAELDKDYDIEVPPEKAFGERDPKLIEIFPLPKLRRMGADIDEEGNTVKIKDREGKIIRMSGSRAWVDFNHPQGGHPLKYWFKVVRVADNDEEKVRGLIDIFYTFSDEFGIEIDGSTVKLVPPGTAKFDTQWQFSKLSIVSGIFQKLGLDKVLVVEEYDKPEEKADEPEEEEAPADEQEPSEEEDKAEEEVVEESPVEEDASDEGAKDA